MQTNIWDIQGDQRQVVHATAGALGSLGYRVEPDPSGQLYHAEIGSAVMRFLFGGFVQRHKIDFAISANPAGALELHVRPAMRGWGGGAIGKGRSTNDHDRALAAIQQQVAGSGLIANPRHVA